MEPNEIMTNEDVTKTIVEVTTEKAGNGLEMAVVGGLVVVGSYALYKYAIKPLVAKLKTKNAQTVTVQVSETREVASEEPVTE